MLDRTIDKRKYLDPQVIARLDNMNLRARLAVEGFIIGLHKSPYHGFSVEFAEHRPYMPGDEIGHLDWKLYGKTDRFYVKEFEEETNLKSYLLIDKSASMRFATAEISKLDYARYLAAALAYLMLKQQDAVGLIGYDTEERFYLPPRARSSHLNQVLGLLEKMEAGGETGIAAVLHRVAEKIKKRGLVILISDLLDEPREVLKALKHFRYNHHELIVFHVLDPQEIQFRYANQTRFIDLEKRQSITTEPWFIREAYQDLMRDFIATYRRECRRNSIDYQLLQTDQMLDLALTEYLNKRSRLG